MKNHVDENTIGKIYFITDLHYIKIGFTTEKLERRFERLQTGNPQQLYIIGYITGTIDIENKLHKKFAYCQHRNNTEWFTLDDGLINFINENNENNSYIEKDGEKIFVYVTTRKPSK